MGALALVAGLVGAHPAAANPATIVASPSDIIVTWAVSGGDGSSQATAIVYTVTVDDCSKAPTVNSRVTLNSATRADDLGKWFTIDVTCTAGFVSGTTVISLFGSILELGPATRTTAGGNDQMTFQLLPDSVVPAGAGFQSGFSIRSSSSAPILVIVVQFDPVPSSSSSDAPEPDPRDATSAVVAEQLAAASVEGSSSALRVRGTEVLPVTSRLSSAIGPRGGVALSSEGLEVRVASVLGARADAGVLVPSSGEIEASVMGPLVPGSVVEAWINSTPRLVAAAEVREDGATVIVIPTGAPLDSGGPIEDGAHTLELRMFTADGFEIVATGITIGSPVPSGVPAGEGGMPVGAGLLVLLGAAGAALVAGRRLVTAG